MAEYIKREDVITLAKQGKLVSNRNYESVCAYINSVPAADVVERKNGKWIIKDNPGTGWYRVTCSACGEDVTSTAPVIGFFPDAKITWNYCPECGSYNGGDDDV